MHREQPVVEIGADEVAGWRGQLEPHQRGGGSADEEEQRDAGEKQNRDALVIGGEEPRAQPIVGGEIILIRAAHRGAPVCSASDLI